MALRGKIAAITGDESVVINLGSAQGVKPGMRFRAVFETGPIRDPDDPNRTLGELVYEIAKLQAVNVMENMSICSVPASVSAPGLTFGSGLFGQTKSKIDPAET